MEKKKIQWGQIISTVVSVLIGFFCGIFLVQYNSSIPKTYSWEELLWAVALIIMLYFATIVQMIIHEAGHLLFGHLSGYTFSSFRIMNFMWIKKDGKLKLCKLSIAGTGGQCLMSPPDLVEGKIPVILYNLGGSILNLITTVVFVLLYIAFLPLPFLSATMLMFALVGFVFAVLNGLPLRMGTVDSDGYNAYALTRSSEAMRAFWIQMKVNQQISLGLRLKDMPDEWFEIPSDEQMHNSMVAVLGVFACNRMMDQHRFQEADQQMAHQLEIESGMVGLHRCLMICDRIYLELIGENRSDVIDRFITKDLNKFMKSMKNFPSILRTRYALALLHEKDKDKASSILAEFNKAAATYPYPQEVTAEKEFLDFANKQ